MPDFSWDQIAPADTAKPTPPPKKGAGFSWDEIKPAANVAPAAIVQPPETPKPQPPKPPQVNWGDTRKLAQPPAETQDFNPALKQAVAPIAREVFPYTPGGAAARLAALGHDLYKGGNTASQLPTGANGNIKPAAALNEAIQAPLQGATAVLPAALASAPAATAIGIGTAALAQGGTAAGLRKLGVDESTAELGGTVAGLVAGGVAGHKASPLDTKFFSRTSETPPPPAPPMAGRADLAPVRPQDSTPAPRGPVIEARTEAGKPTAFPKSSPSFDWSQILPADEPERILSNEVTNEQPTAASPRVDTGRTTAGPTPPLADRAGTQGRDASQGRLLIPGSSDSYPVRYAVRELEQVQPSHNGLNFEPNPRYSYTNDRDYGDPRNQERILRQTGQFRPEYLLTDTPDNVNGPPVVDQTGSTLGGNSRVMTLQRVYGSRPDAAQAYRDLLTQKAPQFGIDPAQVQAMKRPVLVRELLDSAVNPQQVITDTNKTGTAALTSAERALADAHRVTTRSFDAITQQMDRVGPDATLAQAIEGDGGRAVLDALVNDGAITPQEKAQYLTSKSTLTEEGKIRVRRLVSGRLFDTPEQFDTTPPSLRDKVEKLAPTVLRLASREDWDLAPTVRDALAILEQARAAGIKNLDDLVNQQGMFGESNIDPQSLQFAKRLQADGPRQLADNVAKYAEMERESRSGQTLSMFGEPPTQPQAFSDVFGGPVTERTVKPLPRPPQPQASPAVSWEDIRPAETPQEALRPAEEPTGQPSLPGAMVEQPAPYEPAPIDGIDPNEYLNFRRSNLPDASKDILGQRVVEGVQERGSQPKPVIGFDEIQKQVDGYRPEDIARIENTPRGRYDTLSLTDQQAARQHLETLIRNEVEMGKRLNDTTLAPEQRAAMEGELAQAQAESRKWTEIVSHVRSQSGRGLSYWGMVARETWDPSYWYTQAKRAAGLRTNEELPESQGRELSAILREGRTVESTVADEVRNSTPATEEKEPAPLQPEEHAALVRLRDRLVSRKQAALDRLKQRGNFSGNTLGSMALDPRDALDLAEVGASHLAIGALDFASWSAAMIRDVGEQVKPYLEQIYEAAQDHLVKASTDSDQARRPVSREQLLARLAKMTKARLRADIEGPRQGASPFSPDELAAIQNDPEVVALKQQLQQVRLQRGATPTREQAVQDALDRRVAALQQRLKGKVQGPSPISDADREGIENNPRVQALKAQLPGEETQPPTREDLLQKRLDQTIQNLKSRLNPKQGASPFSPAELDAIKQNPEVQRLVRELEAARPADQSPPGTRLTPTRDELIEAAVQRNVKATEDQIARGGQPKQPGPRALTAEEQERVKNDPRVIAVRKRLALFMAQQEKAGPLENIDSVRKAAMLTGLGTHVTNMLSNAGMQATEEAARLPAALADMLLKPMLSKQRTVAGVSPRAVQRAAVEAGTRGWREAKEIMRQGATSAELAKMEVHRELNTGTPILDKAVNTVFRSLSAEDRLARVYSYRRAIDAQAEVIGKNKGLSRAEVEQLKAKPTDRMVMEALGAAEFSTFNNPNVLAKGLTNMGHYLKQQGPAGKTAAFGMEAVLPFKNTPANVFARMLDYSGVSGVPKVAVAAGRIASHMRDAKAAGTPFDQTFLASQQKVIAEALGRGSIGTAMIAMGYYAAKNGMATPARPDDASMRNAQETAGRQWGSLKVGNAWVPIDRVFPLFTVGSTLYFEGNRSLKDEAKRPERIATTMGKVLLDQPMLKGMSDAEEALKSPGSKGSALVSGFAGSFVPSGLSALGALTDRARRDTRSDSTVGDIKNAVQSRIPGLRNLLPPKIDGLGRPLPQSSTAMLGAAGVDWDRSNGSRVNQELLRTRVGLPAVEPLPGEPYDKYRQRIEAAGRLVNQRLEQLVNSPGYQNARDLDAQSYLMKQTITQAHHQALADWKAQHGIGNVPKQRTGRAY